MMVWCEPPRLASSASATVRIGDVVGGGLMQVPWEEQLRGQSSETGDECERTNKGTERTARRRGQREFVMRFVACCCVARVAESVCLRTILIADSHWFRCGVAFIAAIVIVGRLIRLLAVITRVRALRVIADCCRWGGRWGGGGRLVAVVVTGGCAERRRGGGRRQEQVKRQYGPGSANIKLHPRQSALWCVLTRHVVSIVRILPAVSSTGEGL